MAGVFRLELSAYPKTINSNVMNELKYNIVNFALTLALSQMERGV